MPIYQNFNLQTYNTFGIQASTQYFAQINTKEELIEIINHPKYSLLPRFLLGGGSNVLLTQDFPGIIFHLNFAGIWESEQDSNYVLITAGASEIWENLVNYAIEKNYSGIENLTAIPGTTGAAPVQNIGAYGAEIKDCLEYVTIFDVTTCEESNLNKSECNFGYRHSIFQSLKNYWVTGVTLRLNKQTILNIQYNAIQEEIRKLGLAPTTIREVANIIRSIRQQKLPDPKVLGNAGSFFKNPQISLEQYLQLQEQYPKIVGYPSGERFIKVAAGWLIEQCGWKGKRVGNVGVYAQQALILVNHGNATGREILSFARQIQDSVYNKFGITLTPEVVII